MHIERPRYSPVANRVTVAAHIFAVLTFALLLIWLLHYREGIDYGSDYPLRVFNAHPFFMVFGFILFSGEAIMAYNTMAVEHKVQKFCHMILHLTAFCFGVVGISAVFKYHDMAGIQDMYSLHSWIGLSTIILFGFQWLFGFATFMLGSSLETRARVLPWHASGGRVILYMAICAAMTGLTEKFSFLELHDEREARLLNFIGLSILLFGIFVDLSIAVGRYLP